MGVDDVVMIVVILAFCFACYLSLSQDAQTLKISYEKFDEEDVYEMCYWQDAQIDCGVTECHYNEGGGQCGNPSPAITLNNQPNGKGNLFVCWSRKDKDKSDSG